MDERTEELLPQGPKKRNINKNTIFIVSIIAILVIALAVVVYLLFSRYKNQQFNQNLDIAQKYLDEGDYENAIISFNDAIKITNKKENLEVANTGLSKAASFSNNIEEAEKAYQNLYDLTDNTYYLNQKNLVNYGNSDSNISNRANTASRADISYYLQENGSKTEVWKIENESSNKLSELSNTDFNGIEASVKNVNAWGDQIYMIYNGDIISMDIKTGEYKTLISANSVITTAQLQDYNSANISYFQIYNNQIYFLVNPNTDIAGGSILTCNIDGSGIVNRFNSIAGVKMITSFFIYNNDIYITYSDTSGHGSELIKANLNTNEEMSLFVSNVNQRILTSAVKDNKVYYNMLTLPEEMQNDYTYSNDIYYTDIETGEDGTISSPGSVSAINVLDDTLYYVSNNKFCSSDLDGNNQTEIGDAPNIDTQGSYLKHTITVTNNDCYVTSSKSQNTYVLYGLGAETNRAPVDDITNYQSIRNVINSTPNQDKQEQPQVENIVVEDEPVVSSNPAWKEAYIDYIQSDGDKTSDTTYNLININDDDIPELYINYGYTAGGDKLITYSNSNGLDVLRLWNYGLSYLRRQNKFIDFSGHMDHYTDNIYKIENGKFVTIMENSYGLPSGVSVPENFEYRDGHPYATNYEYIWNGSKVSADEYFSNLRKNFDESAAKSATDLNNMSQSQVISDIRTGNY